MGETRLFPLDGAQRSHPDVRSWLSSRADPLGPIARRWFEALRACGPDVTEILHDGHPTACVAGAAFAYVNAFKDHVNVGFFNGANLRDPARLLQGTGRFMRHVKVRPGAALDEAALAALIETACADMRQLAQAAAAR